MISIYLIFLVISIDISYGAKWNDFTGDDGKITFPLKKDIADLSGWSVFENDDNLNLKWYQRGEDDTFNLGYDNLGNCAAVRFIAYEKDIDPLYISMYKDADGIFEAFQHKELKAYKSVVLFSPEDILKKGGRELSFKGEKEVAYFGYLKEGKVYKMLNRDTCKQAAYYVEQGCTSKRGITLTNFGIKSDCKALKPFYTIYNTEGNGDMIGFGWVYFGLVSRKHAFLKAIPSQKVKELFPHSPSCFTTCSNLGVMEIWLTHDESEKTNCPGGSWVDSKCKNIHKAVDDSYSDS